MNESLMGLYSQYIFAALKLAVNHKIFSFYLTPSPSISKRQCLKVLKVLLINLRIILLILFIPSKDSFKVKSP